VEDQCAGFKDMPKKISTIACTPSDWIRNEVRWGRRALGLDGGMLADERQEKGAVKKKEDPFEAYISLCCARGEVQKYGIAC